MRAIPMRGRLTGKRVAGFIWAGHGQSWTKKERYFQLEDRRLVSAALTSRMGAFVIRFNGSKCEIKVRNAKGRVLSTAVLVLPRGWR